MKTRITYYAEKIASGSLSAYQASLHFGSLERFRKVLERAEIIKTWNDSISANNCLKERQINCAWEKRADDLYLEWAILEYKAINDYWEYDAWRDEFVDDWNKAELEAMDIPSDRQLWICRQARNAANTFPKGKSPWEVPHIPEEAWKKFFKTYRLSQSEMDMFWAEYCLHAYDIFN